jgi:hypothetical protein
MIMPIGSRTLVSFGAVSDDAFDGVHGASFCQVNDKLFLITPKRIYDIAHGSGDTITQKLATVAGEWHTGSWARWRGEVIAGKEKAPAAALGGDSSTRYAEADPSLYTISSDTWAEMVGTAAEDYVSHIISARGQIWWTQNRGRFAAPELRWSDDTEADFQDIAAPSVYGPFRIEQGGYSTWLHLAGPHILVFKRDGSIIGVDQNQIWIPYTAQRQDIEDDRFGSGVAQFLSLLAVPDLSGALLFNPNNLITQSLEASRVQAYPAIANNNFIGLTRAFTARNPELFAFGQTPNGVAMYIGVKFDDGFFYAADYGVYATTTAGSPADNALKLRGATSQTLRGTTAATLRTPPTPDTFTEEPMCATVLRVGDTARVYVAHRVTTTDKVKLYRIDIAGPGWQSAPESVNVGTLWTSKLYGDGPLAGVTKLPIGLRGGYVSNPNGNAANQLVASIGVDEGLLNVFGWTGSSGTLSMPIPANQQTAGRSFSLAFSTPALGDFRLEGPLYLDFLYAQNATATNDHVTILVTTGEVLDNLMGDALDESGRVGMQRLDALHNQTIDVEFSWGETWSVFVEKVEVQQLQSEVGRSEGSYLTALECRRLS